MKPEVLRFCISIDVRKYQLFFDFDEHPNKLEIVQYSNVEITQNAQALIYKFLSKEEKSSEWELHSKKLKETLNKLNLRSEKSKDKLRNESSITPLIDTIKDLVTEIPESEDDN